MLNRYFVSVQVNIEDAAKLVDEFQAIWTPSLNFFGRKRKRIYYVEGWLPPSEFAALLTLVRGHYYLRGKKYNDAEPCFKELFEQNPLSHFAPEALYYRGVSRYLLSHEVDTLKEEWIRLQRFYPQSAWSIRSDILG
jgi:hypothetical protein